VTGPDVSLWGASQEGRSVAAAYGICDKEKKGAEMRLEVGLGVVGKVCNIIGKTATVWLTPKGRFGDWKSPITERDPQPHLGGMNHVSHSVSKQKH